MNRLKHWASRIIQLVIRLITRYPWAIAIFGFVSGVASFFLVEREQEKFAQMVSALMLVSWVWLTLEKLLQRSVSSWFGIKLPPPLVSFATQLVHQESLFFVIPFFFFSTTWNGGQLIFTSILIISAFISIVDPIYYRWLAARRWLYFIFHGITLFAVLLTALPIIFHLPTPKSYLLSLVIAVLLSLPGILREFMSNWWKRSLLALILIVVVGAIGIFIRPWIPPATLRLTQVAITNSIKQGDRSPENTLSFVTVEQLRTGLYAYTAISAPRGLNERIYHVWRLNGMEVDRIALDINGGREAGYRAWTHKLNFPPYPTGRWKIHVITEANQVIGILRFQVVETLTAEQSANVTKFRESEVIPQIDDESVEQQEDRQDGSLEDALEKSIIDESLEEDQDTHQPNEDEDEEPEMEAEEEVETEKEIKTMEQSSTSAAPASESVLETVPAPEVEVDSVPVEESTPVDP